MLNSNISHSQSNISAKESQIRKNMMANPELVKKLVKEILDSNEKLPDTTSANMYIYYGFAQNLLNSPDSAIYYYKKSLPFTEEYPKSRAKAYLNLGVSYRKLTQYDTSIRYLKQSEALNNLNNRTGLGMVYGEIASVYNQQVKPEKAIEYLLKAIDLIKDSNKPANLNPLKQRLAGTYMGTQNYAFAADIYADVLAYFKASDQKNYFVTLVNYGQCLYFLKNYPKAKTALNEALPGLKKFNDLEATGMALSWLGAIAFKERNFVEGENYYDKALNILYEKKSYSSHSILLQYLTDLNKSAKYDKASKVIAYSERQLKGQSSNAEIKINLERQKAFTHQQNDEKDKSILSLQKVIVFKDSINTAGNKAMLNKLQAQYQNELQREKNISLSKNNKLLALKIKNETQQKIILIGLFGAALCIIIGGYLLYRFKRRLEKEKLKSITIKNELIAQQYQNEQESNKLLKKSLIEKQTDLVAGAMRLAEVQENINDMLTVVNKEDIVNADFLTKKLETLIKQEDYWEAFEKKFSEAHPNFKRNMSEAYPALNKTDLFFATLLKLKLPYKEIGRLLSISSESVVKRKYRLKKKMFIEDEEEFDKILSEL